ncbi:hypothetical protein PoB_007181500 [Plakobranchus ocellatus]|uniref:Uncharacterized protein n=1 Tax=Plakobranchus ocellatus TaxID=259542 RepID=A0AAV4DME9_9GAST|nr:hypothetical protein PoB_007181500 [Plakobranchus ocellatus]
MLKKIELKSLKNLSWGLPGASLLINYANHYNLCTVRRANCLRKTCWGPMTQKRPDFPRKINRTTSTLSYLLITPRKRCPTQDLHTTFKVLEKRKTY